MQLSFTQKKHIRKNFGKLVDAATVLQPSSMAVGWQKFCFSRGGHAHGRCDEHFARSNHSMDGLRPGKKIVDLESLGLVKVALLRLGLESEFVEIIWEKEILHKYIEFAESQVSKVSDAIHHHMKECLDGNFGALDTAQADKVLLLLPGKCSLKQHLSQFFKVVKETGQILTSGPLANATKLASTLSALEQLKKNEPAFGQELTKIGAFRAGGDSTSLSKFFDDMIDKLRVLESKKNSKTQSDIRKAIAATIGIINGICVTAEKQFRVDMKKAGTKLATQQKEVKALLTLLQVECPNVEAEAGASQQDDQTPAALYKKAENAEKICIEYTCVFVALQLWGNEGVHKDGANGESLRTSLAKALSTRAACACQDIFKPKMEEISKILAAKGAASSPSAAAETTASG